MNSKRDYQYLELFRNKFLIYKYSPLCVMSDFLEHTGFTGLISFDCPTCCLSRGLFYFIFLLGIADGLYGNYTTWWHLWCFFFHGTTWPLWELYDLVAFMGVFLRGTMRPLWELYDLVAYMGVFLRSTTWRGRVTVP